MQNLEIATYILGALVVILLVWNIRTERRIKKITTGKGGADLEEAINFLVDEVKAINLREKNTAGILSNNHERLKRSIQGVELIRFNPFNDSGSNQSFAIALLNEEGDGLVISSLYSRERMSVFAKPIKNLASSHELSDEEKEVLKKASIGK